MPDAFRLCAGYIPDPTRVEHCLRQNKSDLSDACRSVFEQSAGPGGQQKQINDIGCPVGARPECCADAAGRRVRQQRR